MPELDPQARKSWDCFVDLHAPEWDGGVLDYPTTRAVADYLTALESERATLHARAEAAELQVAVARAALLKGQRKRPGFYPQVSLNFDDFDKAMAALRPTRASEGG